MRSTDAKPVSRFRTSRYFCISGEWYFSTRENMDFGPYLSREHAEMALSRYLETQSIIHYLRGADPALESEQEAPEQLVARLSQALQQRACDDVSEGCQHAGFALQPDAALTLEPAV